MESPQGYAGTATGPAAVHPQAQEERNYALWAHLSALAGLVVPFGQVIGPVIVYALGKDKGPFAAHHGKEALNFQITVMLALAVLFAGVFGSMILALFLIGLVLMPLVFVLIVVIMVGGAIMAIVGGLAANRGEWYRYPLAIRFIR